MSVYKGNKVIWKQQQQVQPFLKFRNARVGKFELCFYKIDNKIYYTTTYPLIESESKRRISETVAEPALVTKDFWDLITTDRAVSFLHGFAYKESTQIRLKNKDNYREQDQHMELVMEDLTYDYDKILEILDTIGKQIVE